LLFSCGTCRASCLPSKVRLFRPTPSFVLRVVILFQGRAPLSPTPFSFSNPQGSCDDPLPGDSVPIPLFFLDNAQLTPTSRFSQRTLALIPPFFGHVCKKDLCPLPFPFCVCWSRLSPKGIPSFRMLPSAIAFFSPIGEYCLCALPIAFPSYAAPVGVPPPLSVVNQASFFSPRGGVNLFFPRSKFLSYGVLCDPLTFFSPRAETLTGAFHLGNM